MNDFPEIPAAWCTPEAEGIYLSLLPFLQKEYSSYTCYPQKENIFRALELTPPEKVKAVIIGQDPYHGERQATGLAFAVPEKEKLPPSLRNIFTEIRSETGACPQSGDLAFLAAEGVLLLNRTLTVRAGQPASHAGAGWEAFTAQVVQQVAGLERPVAWLLWGSHAQRMKEYIKNPLHLVLESVHPSPLSAYRGFFGCGHFAAANEFFVRNGIPPIDWSGI